MDVREGWDRHQNAFCGQPSDTLIYLDWLSYLLNTNTQICACTSCMLSSKHRSIKQLSCGCVMCCRRCILRASFLPSSSLMWAAWGSWSLRSSLPTEPLSSELKLKASLYQLVVSAWACSYKHVCFCWSAANEYRFGFLLMHLPDLKETTLLFLYFCLHFHSAERNDWVAVLQDCTRGRQLRNTLSPGSPLAPDYQGYLELRGIRSKLYTVVALDKVFLYKNMEVSCPCLWLQRKAICRSHWIQAVFVFV